MNWISIAVGAGAGVVAVIVSSGVLKLIGKANTRGANIFRAIVVVVALALGREYVVPRIQAEQVESSLLNMPIYQALKQYEPDTYRKILLILEQGIARKQPIEQMWPVTRPVIGELLIKRLPHSSDAVVLKFGEYSVSAITNLYSKGGTSCFSYMNPRPGEALDFVALLGKEAVQQELNLMAEVFISAAGKTRTPVTKADASPDFEAVVSKLFEKYTQGDMANILDPQSPNIDKRKYCQISIDLYKEAIALPEPRNARVIRYLLQAQ